LHRREEGCALRRIGQLDVGIGVEQVADRGALIQTHGHMQSGFARLALSVERRALVDELLGEAGEAAL